MGLSRFLGRLLSQFQWSWNESVVSKPLISQNDQWKNSGLGKSSFDWHAALQKRFTISFRLLDSISLRNSLWGKSELWFLGWKHKKGYCTAKMYSISKSKSKAIKEVDTSETKTIDKELAGKSMQQVELDFDQKRNGLEEWGEGGAALPRMISIIFKVRRLRKSRFRRIPKSTFGFPYSKNFPSKFRGLGWFIEMGTSGKCARKFPYTVEFSFQREGEDPTSDVFAGEGGTGRAYQQANSTMYSKDMAAKRSFPLLIQFTTLCVEDQITA